VGNSILNPTLKKQRKNYVSHYLPLFFSSFFSLSLSSYNIA
jgi:hypothetical protein